jgi:hypothetical protein
MSETLELTGVHNLRDKYVTELARVENLGVCSRLIFSLPRQDGNDAYREGIASLIVPTASIPQIVQMLSKRPTSIRKRTPDDRWDDPSSGEITTDERLN